MSSVLQWLSSRGVDRRLAAEQAAYVLLLKYRQRWEKIVPIELHRLAASLNCRISQVRRLEGGARLLPISGGFEVLVSAELPLAKHRMAIAHELAHTLFYSFENEIPMRLVEPSPREEHFCFDVARRILAPDWLIADIRRFRLAEPKDLFDCLTKRFKLSKLTAARVMLEDYQLAVGVAGRWRRVNEQWKLDRGRAFASPSLKPRDRKLLHAAAKRWLSESVLPEAPYGIIGLSEASGEGVFVCVANPSARRCA